VWSARNVIAATACKREKIAPATIATKIEIQGVKLPNVSTNVRLKTIAENAPITINPSSPILTTPERSEKIPPNAAKRDNEPKGE